MKINAVRNNEKPINKPTNKPIIIINDTPKPLSSKYIRKGKKLDKFL